ncbi:MAG: hypothetical protein ACJA1B_001400 [Polaribacter sp.]|jgi:hypothetical protein
MYIDKRLLEILETHKGETIDVNFMISLIKTIAEEHEAKGLILFNFKSPRELLIDFLISTENGVIEKERGKAEVWVDEYLKIN